MSTLNTHNFLSRLLRPYDMNSIKKHFIIFDQLDANYINYKNYTNYIKCSKKKINV